MYVHKYEIEIPEDHHLNLEIPADCPVGSAEIIILSNVSANVSTPDKNLEDFLNWLETQPPSGRSKEEIDADIAAERAAWGD